MTVIMKNPTDQQKTRRYHCNDSPSGIQHGRALQISLAPASACAMVYAAAHCDLLKKTRWRGGWFASYISATWRHVLATEARKRDISKANEGRKTIENDLAAKVSLFPFRSVWANTDQILQLFKALTSLQFFAGKAPFLKSWLRHKQEQEELNVQNAPHSAVELSSAVPLTLYNHVLQLVQGAAGGERRSASAGDDGNRRPEGESLQESGHTFVDWGLGLQLTHSSTR